MARDKPSCYDKGAELLSIRPHFAAELDRKLRQRGYGEDEIVSTLSRFEELGYLDDEACARSFVAGRLRRSPVGRLRLVAELGRRGVGADAVAAVIAEVSDREELEAAGRAAEKWLRSSRRAQGSARQAAGRAEALGRHLGRKGFEKRVILGVLQALGDPESASRSESDCPTQKP